VIDGSDYVALHVHTEHSELDGLARVGELVAAAVAMGMSVSRLPTTVRWPSTGNFMRLRAPRDHPDLGVGGVLRDRLPARQRDSHHRLR
jgi:hypothetical protein